MHRNTLPDKMLWLEPDRTPFAHSPPIVNTSMQHAHWLLRLLWEADAARDGLRELDWDLLLHVARPNGVLVRTAERLAAQGVTVPDRFAAAVAQERQRIRSALELMRHVSLACEAHGITFLFPKAFQDYPDFGDDVDLLVLPRSTRVDSAIVGALPATLVKRDLGERLAGRVRIALCDISFTVSTVRRTALDWDYVIATATEHAALPGLAGYLDYVNQIHHDVWGAPLLPDAVGRSLGLHGWGRMAFRDGSYRLPIVRANSRLSWRQLRHRIGRGDWTGAGRLCLLPLVAAARLIGRLTRTPERPSASRPGAVRTKPLAHVSVGE